MHNMSEEFFPGDFRRKGYNVSVNTHDLKLRQIVAPRSRVAIKSGKGCIIAPDKS